MTASRVGGTQESGLAAGSSQPPRLLDILRTCASKGGHAAATIDAFVSWTTRYIVFHSKRHPRELVIGDVARFLQYVVQTEREPLVALEQGRLSTRLPVLRRSSWADCRSNSSDFTRR